MTIDLYHAQISPPCHMVRMLARALGIHVNLVEVDIFGGEHLTPEFGEMSPQRTIPLVKDGGFFLSESRPILGYLVSKYAKNDSMYPTDPKKKGIVDQRLYFDIEKLYSNIFKCWFPVAFGAATTVDEKNIRDVEETFEILDLYLQDNDYVAGENLTIADISILVSVTVAEIYGFDPARYDNVAGWYERCKSEMSNYGYEEFINSSSKLGEFYRANVEAPEEE